MTDLQIVGEALRHEGFTQSQVRSRIDRLRDRYMEEMRKATGNGKQLFELLPGVRDVLSAVAEHPRYRSALLTGNIEPAAYLKMELVGLSEFFVLPGAFGDESHDRRDLPAWAAERIRRHLNLELEAQHKLGGRPPGGTGTNRRSIDSAVTETENGPQAELFTQSGYGGYPEVGTSKMRAQPYLWPGGVVAELPA